MSSDDSTPTVTKSEAKRIRKNREAAEFRSKHRQELADKASTYRKEHPESFKASQRAHYETHKEERKAKSRDRYHSNPQKSNAQNKAWRESHPEEVKQYMEEHREQRNAQSHAWYVEHVDERRAYNSTHYTEHADEHAAKNKRFHQTHPGKASEYSNRRRALKQGAALNDFTDTQWQAMKAAYGHQCVYCPLICKACQKQTHRLTQDHITPLSKGGPNTLTNIVPACQSCNSKKRAGAPLVPVQPLLLI